jgi:DNA-binding transcriptional ArsR family regulator
MDQAAHAPASQATDLDPMIAASEQAASLLRAMANPVRLRILCLVAEGERGVGDIAECLGIREPAASQQLTQLRLEGLVASRRDAQRVFYRLASNEVEQVLATLRDIYCPADIMPRCQPTDDSNA